MSLKFKKYQGTGNDFIILDNRECSYDGLDQKSISFLCDRKFGVGADGLILLESSVNSDFKMVYYNSDGNESSMCGNGGRCLLRFANDIGLIKESYTFEAIDGLHHGKVFEDIVHLQMIDVSLPMKQQGAFFIDTGSPHHIVLNRKLSDLNLVKDAKEIRYSDFYKEEGVNVNFVEVLSTNSISLRTYERGVEDETLSCGTGVTAAVLTASYNKLLDDNKDIKVFSQGGELALSFECSESGYTNIWLKGPAKFVFEGTIEINE